MENVAVKLAMIVVGCAPNPQRTADLQQLTAMAIASEQLHVTRVEIVLAEVLECNRIMPKMLVVSVCLFDSFHTCLNS